MEAQDRQVVLFVADISGYTKFIISNEKDVAHSQIIIRELLTSILDEIRLPLEIVRLEGDAVFLYAFKDDPKMAWEKVSKDLVFNLLTLFRVFSNKVSELTVHKICNCNACNNVDRLKLKIVAHSGRSAFFEIDGKQELTGVDPIIVHRMLKNSIQANEYVLLTESAYRDLKLPSGKVEEHQETYDEIGTLDMYVYYPPQREPHIPRPDANFPTIFINTLRSEISREYAQVAEYPELGFHFHTGRPLATLLQYEDEWLDGFPESVIESFAGTGNPFSLGELESGEKVVDMGCGAGLDCLIASRMVGPTGEVIGIDMTPEMINKARQNAFRMNTKNITFMEGFNESLPVSDEWADVVISNGAINLSPDKKAVFKEINRVLKPGGRIQISDILVQTPIPEGAKQKVDLWVG
ncbi:MAG: DUF2652 domain-containing protein [Anaerolineales bacterium]|nr:DUF2652 domain-containing protein [Anaerolineales bacterium]